MTKTFKIVNNSEKLILVSGVKHHIWLLSGEYVNCERVKGSWFFVRSWNIDYDMGVKVYSDLVADVAKVSVKPDGTCLVEL